MILWGDCGMRAQLTPLSVVGGSFAVGTLVARFLVVAAAKVVGRDALGLAAVPACVVTARRLRFVAVSVASFLVPGVSLERGEVVLPWPPIVLACQCAGAGEEGPLVMTSRCRTRSRVMICSSSRIVLNSSMMVRVAALRASYVRASRCGSIISVPAWLSASAAVSTAVVGKAGWGAAVVVLGCPLAGIGVGGDVDQLTAPGLRCNCSE